ncbi:microviridin/marinostatin family tricyclic proteinase inhibitor [Dolichospermum sp. ST_con]|nr:microviridin/marinostatin family tricyclic proteinase inhibitor [Dolichospermum sp. ST_con]MDD1421288.1 microviridin/marinostatin family tricyclic proteinase inhibitor [Dolichospermum sp. ST_sed1]MDD1426770.1 microviridin/marinostatin family tricyclic proteinase inhibitor [Dolichospermum sp. ST_sed9]MDD1433900.1 microviridin/marinostatin family tricyclic proteinase inhibitor [Dolichospermum sp. ST_sed6]MDD1435232.1 microviridin/marinostatin family tricyclic proteinase inhibitor [Dolichosperm
MTTATLTNIEALPFFARFLAAEEPPETPTPQPEEQPLPPPIYTFKWPSDWEDL